jgi:quinol monooxygenase YgiN
MRRPRSIRRRGANADSDHNRRGNGHVEPGEGLQKEQDPWRVSRNEAAVPLYREGGQLGRCDEGDLMGELQGIVRFTFHADEVEEFKRLSAECLEIVRTKDVGTLQYDTYFNDDESECIVLERFRDSDALILHGQNHCPPHGVDYGDRNGFRRAAR